MNITDKRNTGLHTWIGICWISIAPLASANTGASLGQQIAEHGTDNMPACAVCHGMHGEGDKAAGYPRLAGMSADYLLDQLNSYAAGTRSNRAMRTYSQTLSLAARQAVANYYAAQPGLSAQKLTSPRYRSPITTLLIHGDPSHNIPACFSCHGAKGAGTHLIPAIADQPSQYLVTQMNHWRTGTRPVGEGDPMAIIAKNLSAMQIASIARYLADETPPTTP